MTNELLRHTIATIAYRFRASVRKTNSGFEDFKISDHTRTPNEILSHIFDLAYKTRHFATSGHFNLIFPTHDIKDFAQSSERFLLELQKLDDSISQQELNLNFSKQLLQGPLLDICTHIGQLALLNGIHGNKVPAENYSIAPIATGNII